MTRGGTSPDRRPAARGARRDLGVRRSAGRGGARHARLQARPDPRARPIRCPGCCASSRRQHPGVRVQGEALPWSSDEQHQFYVINLEGGSPGFDVMMLDCIWVPGVRPRRLAARPHRRSLAPDELAPYFPTRRRRRRRYGGRVWALPWNMNVGLLYYRTRSPRQVRSARRPRRTTELVRAGPTGSAPASAIRRLDGYPLAGQAVRGAGRERARGAVGQRHRAARRGRRDLPRPGARRRRRSRFLRGLIERGVSPAWMTAADEELTRRAFGDGQRDLPQELAVRDGSLRAPGLAGARPGGHRAACRAIAHGRAAASARRAARIWRVHRGTRHPDRGGRRSSRFLTSEAAAARDGGRRRALARRAQALYHDAGPRARAPGAARHRTRSRSPGGRGRSRPTTCMLSHAAPARALGGARRREDARARGGGCAAGRSGSSCATCARTRRARRGDAPPARRPAPGPARISRRRWSRSAALTVYPGRLGALALAPAPHARSSASRASPASTTIAFLAVDPRFWSAARVTLVFTRRLGGPRGRARAWPRRSLLRAQQRGRRVALGLLLLAWALPAVVTAKLFEWLYHPAAGLVNFLLGGRALNWLGDPALALPGVILADVWRTMPFVAAALLRAPPRHSGRAVRGGAGGRRRPRSAIFRRITLPLLAADPADRRCSSARSTRCAPSTSCSS